MKTLAEAYQQFDLTRLIEEQLVGHPQAINAYVECCERYVGKNKQRLSGKENGQAEHYTFEQLAELSGKLANFFKAQGIQAGDCIAGLLPRTPGLLITILATWRIGAIYQPLFTAFEAKSIDHRITTAQTKIDCDQ